jgi:hypothetical protein
LTASAIFVLAYLTASDPAQQPAPDAGIDVDLKV